MIELFNREYSQQYTCNEFACEAWQKITGEDLSKRLNDHLNGVGSFKELVASESPCIAFFSINKKLGTHVGVFYKGKILHLSMRGVQYVPLEFVMIGFREVRFYK